MNVIYDESKAIQKKKEIDDALPEENRRARIHNTSWTILTVLVGALIAFLGIWTAIESRWVDGTMIFVCIFAILEAVVLIGCIVLSCNLEPTYKSGEYYSALVLYYQATAGKNVLDHKLIPCRDTFWNKAAYKLELILEDENHVVTKYTLPYDFGRQTKTDISDIIVDLENGIVYEPYRSKERES